MWQPIETAPKDGTEIIGGFESGGEFVALSAEWLPDDEDSSAYWAHYPLGGVGGHYSFNPTHWMPLPEPPKCK